LKKIEANRGKYETGHNSHPLAQLFPAPRMKLCLMGAGLEEKQKQKKTPTGIG
jgi:hypothetical protein